MITAETQLICNPLTKKLFAKFLLQRWIDARYELSMPETHDEMQNRNIFVLILFYSYNPGAVLYVTRDAIAIPFVRIWKCANEGIGSNLFINTLYKKSKKVLSAVRLTVKSQSHLSTALNALSHHSVANITRPAFVFVREPYERFLSAFSEVVFRTYDWRKIREPNGSPGQVNLSMAMYYFEQLMDYHTPLVQMEHMYSMSGALFEYNIGVVGYLEKMQLDWTQKIVPTYGLKRPYNDYFGQHPTSMNHPRLGKEEESTAPTPAMINAMRKESDPNNARTAFKSLLSLYPRYMRALCHLLLVDYICLPNYPLPAECGFLNRTRESAVLSIQQGRTIPPHWIQ